MSGQQLHKVIISGGGTGGHIFPAIAIADAIRRRFPECEILFVGAEGKMEMEKVPAAGYRIIGLPVAGLQRKLTLKNLSFPFKLMRSLSKARNVVKEFKPQVAIGVGGYASGPTLRVAGRRGVVTVLQEQNSHPGLTNRILAKKAAVVCTAYPGMEQFFGAGKVRLTGNPVRRDITAQMPDRETAVRQFELDPAKKVLLVLGGSLGARTINESISGALDALVAADIQVIWQCGKYYEASLKPVAEPYADKGIRLMAFISQMNMAYAAANAVVSRAGALSVSELCIAGKPVIFVPSPNVAEDHQTKNARALTTVGAAEMIPDAESREKLGIAAIELLNDQQRCTALGEAIKKLAIPDADERIVNAIMEVLK
jgi:UDP-N-acetylglucosamine--N-acetylmuramyl-(pentapeptide) pyrophosphoryl-undecaprenol N-acetylglucosamine transferase